MSYDIARCIGNNSDYGTHLDSNLESLANTHENVSPTICVWSEYRPVLQPTAGISLEFENAREDGDLALGDLFDFLRSRT